MNTRGQAPKPPWERDYQERLPGEVRIGCLSTFFLIFVTFVSILFACFIFLGVKMLLESEPDMRRADLPIIAGISLVLVLVSAFLFRFGIHLRRSECAPRQVDFGNEDLFFFRQGFMRSLDGPGSAAFTQRGLELTGRLHRLHYWGLLLPLVLFVSFRLLVEFEFVPRASHALTIAVGVLVVLVAFLVEMRHKERRETVSFEAEDIASVQCRGSQVTVRFAAPLAGNLRRVCFLVAPHFREQFFTQFDHTFPQTLPEDYRAACGIARPGTLQ